MRWPLGFQKAPQDQDSLTGELDSPGLDCGYQPDHAHQVVCREAKEEGGDPGGLGLWAAGHDQGSRALTQTDSPSGRQAADGAENPSWQQSCISTFFFFCQHSCVHAGLRFQQPHIWELHARTVNHLVSWPWDPTLSLPEVGLAVKTKKGGFLPRGPPTQG